MFNLFKKKPQGTKVSFKIDGMHCVSCSLNIDGALEDMEGVFSASTSYAKAVTEVEYDPVVVDKSEFKKVIEKEGYKVK